MVVTTTAALDIWTLLVSNVFGSFWLAILGIILMNFMIMAMIGRISTYTATWYNVIFLLAMTLGYKYITLNIFISAFIILAFVFSWKSYIDSK